MSTRTPSRLLAAAAVLSVTTLLAACGSSGDSAESATSTAASAGVATDVSASAATPSSSTSAAPDESASCMQFDQLQKQLEDEGASADVTEQLTQIEQTAKAEGDKEVEAAARELLASEGDTAGWDEALLQVEAVCSGERE